MIENDPEFTFVLLSRSHIVEANTAVEVQTEFNVGGHIVSRMGGENVEQFADRLAKIRLQYARHHGIHSVFISVL